MLCEKNCVLHKRLKVEKEANRYIHRWADIDLAVENGRWGPFIRFKKKSIKLPKNAEGKRMTKEEAEAYVKKMESQKRYSADVWS